jgi:hypothetical protein
MKLKQHIKKYWWIIVIVIILCLFFIRVPYDTFSDNVSGMVCINGELKLKTGGDVIGNYIQSFGADIVASANPFYCSALADGDTGVTSQIMCINGKPIVVCRTQLYKAILMGKIKFINKDTISNQKNGVGSDYEKIQAEAIKGCAEFNLTLSLSIINTGSEPNSNLIQGEGFNYDKRDKTLVIICSDGVERVKLWDLT